MKRASLAMALTFAGTFAVAGVAQQTKKPGAPAPKAPAKTATPATKPAQPTTKAAPVASRADDEKAIHAAVEAFRKAYEAGDAKAVAALFTEEAQIIPIEGEAVRGRAAIEKHFTETFADGPGAKLKLDTKSLHFLTPDLALEEGVASLAHASDEQPGETVRYTVIHCRRDGKWLEALVRDERESKPTPTPRERLMAVEGMVGDWVSESHESVVFTTCKWAEGGNFLVRDYSAQIAGRPATSGTQRIGWDPLSEQIKSWVFDANGGHGEALWSRDGDRWLVKTSVVLPDGQLGTMTNIITIESKDRIRWASVDRTMGGEALPDIEEFLLVRKPPGPK